MVIFMKKIGWLMIFLILVVSFSGCLGDDENMTTENTSYVSVDNDFSDEISQNTSSNFDEYWNSEVFGTYNGYDFTESEVIGMWENLERKSDDMIFRPDYTYRYQLDTANLGSGMRRYEWYEGTWRIENGSLFISLDGQGQKFEDAWIFTKNENGTMNCLNDAVFEKAESIKVS